MSVGRTHFTSAPKLPLRKLAHVSSFLSEKRLRSSLNTETLNCADQVEINLASKARDYWEKLKRFLKCNEFSTKWMAVLKTLSVSFFD